MRINPLPSQSSCVCLLVLALFLLAAPSTASAYGDSGGGGGGLFDDFYHPGKGDKGSGGGNNGGNTNDQWSPPGFMPPPPDGGYYHIDLEVPIRIEPVDLTTNEPVELIEIGPGIGGHPGSGRTPAGNFILVGYRDIVSIVYDKNMGWVGISSRWGFKVKLPMTPFIRQIISNALSGAGGRP